MTPRRRPPGSTKPPRWASLNDTAAYYAVSRDTIKRRIADGSIRAYRVPGSRDIRIDLNQVDAQMTTVPSAVRA